MNQAFHRRFVFASVLGFVLFGARQAHSTPERSQSIEQSFLGANATHWFYFETILVFPGSYYEHIEILRVCSRRKSDGVLVDSTVVSRVRHHRSPDSLKPLPNEARPMGVFDLAAYVRDHAIHLAFDAGVGQTALVDSAGFHIQGEQHRISFIASPGVFQQLPGWTSRESPVVRRAHRVADPWNRDEKGKPRADEWYFEVEFGRSGGDTNWGRFVMYAHRQLP